MVSNQKLLDKDTFNIWHDRLGHPGSIMMRRIIKSATGHPLKNLKVLLPQDLSCVACSLGKFITRPSQTKLIHETPSFLERIQGDICGPIQPQIKNIRMDNAGEFTSQAFNDYCMSIGINVEHSVPHVHTQNGLAESLIKRLQNNR